LELDNLHVILTCRKLEKVYISASLDGLILYVGQDQQDYFA
ncbi:11790_t:CDS:1, partial [Acaulospora morrowiae]